MTTMMEAFAIAGVEKRHFPKTRLVRETELCPCHGSCWLMCCNYKPKIWTRHSAQHRPGIVRRVVG